MSSRAPTVSVIIPAYNAATFIAETLDSALVQTWPHKEIIAVNDGSTDGTAELLRRYENRIRCVHQENRGLGAARNAGLRIAQGDLVAFLDADDLWLPEFLETQVQRLMEEPAVNVVYSWWSYIDENGNELPERGCSRERGDLLTSLVLGNRFPVMAALVRACCIKSTGGFDEDRLVSEDWDFWMRIAQRGHRFDYTPQLLAKYRLHDKNMSLNTPLAHKRYINALNKLYASPQLPERVLRLKSRAYSRVHLTAAIDYFRNSQPDHAAEAFSDGVRIWPELLCHEETFYRLICADQPPGYRATEQFKDLDRAAQRISESLALVFSEPSLSHCVAPLRRKAHAMMFLALAKHYYLADENYTARRLIARAASCAAESMLSRNAVSLWLRAVIGHSRIAQIKHWMARTRLQAGAL